MEETVEASEALQSYIENDIKAGFSDFDEVVENAVDALSEDYDEDLRPAALALAQQVLNAHLAEQKDWPAVTDCDRLVQAFKEIERRGVVCRENFSCCGNCGSYEIWDEIEEVRNEGREVIGYTFYHMQDTEAAVEGQGLYLNYGSVEEGEAAALAIADTIIDSIRSVGLNVQWTGQWSSRIHVALDWKRRWTHGTPHNLDVMRL